MPEHGSGAGDWFAGERASESANKRGALVVVVVVVVVLVVVVVVVLPVVGDVTVLAVVGALDG
jgi:hypothetical protein